MATYEFRELNVSDLATIKELFVSVFTQEPWNDDWSDENQLHLYIMDLIGQNNSLSYGLFDDAGLVAVSMGHMKHWYSGTEYFIDELCVRTEKQGTGIGSCFLEKIEFAVKEKGVSHFFLLTEKDVPAYDFYQKNGFQELHKNVAFVKQF